MSRKDLLGLCGRLGVARLLATATRGRAPLWLTVLAYHRVCQYDPADPWDADVISATPENFRRQLAFIKEYFTPVTSEHVLQWRKGNMPMPGNPIVLTFDDGYRDNHDVALPLLREAGVPADFFICPWHIEHRRLFWWDRIAFVLNRTEKTALALSYPRRLTLDLRTDDSRESAREAILQAVKHTAGLDIQQFVDTLQEAADVAMDEKAEAEKLIMNWDQVRALRRAGMGVGSHSETHRVLSLSDNGRAWKEMRRSRSIIERELGCPVSSIAYPVGGLDSIGEDTKRLARRAGYRVGYSYGSGVSRLRDIDPLEIKRISVEKWMSVSYFQGAATLPFLSYRQRPGAGNGRNGARGGRTLRTRRARRVRPATGEGK